MRQMISSAISKFSSFKKEEYPQGEVVGKTINTYES